MNWLKHLFLPLFLLAACFPAYAGEVIKLPDYSLKYSATTTASKETIWNFWSDVENWKDFDERLAYSYLADGGKFETGASGYLKAKIGPKTKFELVAVNQSVSFVESLKIPLYQTIELQRYFEENDDGATVFTHEVNFKGPLRAVMCALLCGPFKKDLKLVVERLKEMAEREELHNKP